MLRRCLQWIGVKQSSTTSMTAGDLFRGSHANQLAGRIVMTLRIAMVVITLLILVGYQQVTPQSNNGNHSYNELVDKTRTIRKPTDSRDHYQAPCRNTPGD